MTRDELYINNTKADLNKTDITLSYKSNLLTDISKIVSNSSYTIRLPKTANNLALIECAHLPSSISRYPYLKHKGTLLRNGIEIIKDAIVVLLEINESIEIALTWGNVTNFASVVNDGKKLTDLEYGTVEGTDWVVWENWGENSERFPRIDYGFNSNDPNVWRHPVVPVWWILYRIQEESGVTFNFPSDKLTVINKMIIPLLTRNDSHPLFDKFPFIIKASGLRYDGFNSCDVVFSIPDATQQNYGEILSENTFLKSNYEASLISGEIYIGIKYTYSTSSSDYPIILNVYEDSANTSPVISKTIYPQIEQKDGYKSLYFQFSYEVDIKDGYKFDLSLTPRPSIDQNSCFIESDSNINLYLKTKGEISFGEKFPLVPNLPDIKQIDFIKAVASMVGLFALPDGENGIKFIPFDNLSANKSKAVDWTNRVIMAYNSVTPRNLQYTLDNIAQNNWFRYKEDDNVMGNYDGNIQVDDATIEYERDAITLPFSACSTKGGVAYIPLYSYNEEGELEYNKTNPRILLLDGTKGIFKGLEWTTLIANNYQTYKGLINNAKVVTEYIRLNSIELRDLEMDIPVYLAQYGCYLAIIEIKTKENDICECKLLKL